MSCCGRFFVIKGFTYNVFNHHVYQNTAPKVWTFQQRKFLSTIKENMNEAYIRTKQLCNCEYAVCT
jgi:hypothetical protein